MGSLPQAVEHTDQVTAEDENRLSVEKIWINSFNVHYSHENISRKKQLRFFF